MVSLQLARSSLGLRCGCRGARDVVPLHTPDINGLRPVVVFGFDDRMAPRWLRSHGPDAPTVLSQ